MKVSDITTSQVADYLRIDDTSERSRIGYILDAAKAYIKSATSLDDEAIDSHDDLALACLVLCQDLYDNRSMYVDKSNANRVVAAILHQYRENFV